MGIVSRFSAAVAGLLPGRVRKSEPVVDLLDPELRVVVTGYDPAGSCAGALEDAVQAGRFDPGAPAVLRQLVTVAPDGAEELAAAAAHDGYTVATGAAPVAAWPEPAPAEERSDDSRVRLVLCRAGELTGLVCAQERSRVASLAQRHGGDLVGWDGLQTAP